ncbi:hypothetical protein HK097_009186 [Rhizophlyctis rosea]|uniref:E3 ubiquitin-protein ligase SHPRH n=1 Tax=Rhizophlyctis rosea TaxID=64517 RepID=A0AAD5X8A3_9FUNG|nr:hypothetical protein HK097_009186 [Rhizophlyctis rosea]
MDATGALVMKGEHTDQEPLLMEKIVTDMGNAIYVHRLTGAVGLEPWLFNDNARDVLGGILADEMGLGKTVMLLALMSLHRPSAATIPSLSNLEISDAKLKDVHPNLMETKDINACTVCGATEVRDEDRFWIQCDVCDLWDHGDCVGLTENEAGAMETFVCPNCKADISRDHDILIPSSATLIITPSAILDQWGSEIHTHAPHLRMFCYYGVTHHPALFAQTLASFDVVLTTYEVLRKEIHFSGTSPERPRRFEKKYKSRRSLLVEIEWWRVVLDEAQMVDSPVTQAAEMARSIPRQHPWAVTGTPFGKSGLPDLHGLICFLDLRPIATSQPIWRRLITPLHFPHLFSTLQRIMHRNTKANVKSELSLPPQTEEIVVLDFAKVEREVYDQTWELCLDDLKQPLTVGGRRLVARPSETAEMKRKEESLRSDKMRKWLLQLRQTCCHPQIGRHNHNLFGGTLKSIDEVLDVLVKQASANVNSAERNLFQTMIYRTQMDEFEENLDKAMETYQHILKGVRMRVRAAEEDVWAVMACRQVDHAEEEHWAVTARQQVERASVAASEPDTFADSDDEALPNTAGQFSGATSDELASATSRLHSWLEVEHRVQFFIASIHHTLGHDDQESEFYATAEKVRRKMLAPVENEIRGLAKQFERHVAKLWDGILADGGMKMTWSGKWRGGLVIEDVVSQIGALIQKLNDQWAKMENWREKSLEALLARLEDAESTEGEGGGGDGKPSGEEYDRGMNVQEEGYKFQDLYMKAVMDRRQLLLGMRPTEDGKNLVAAAAFEPATEFKVRREQESLDLRKPYMLPKDHQHLRALISELRQHTQEYLRAEELAIAQEVLRNVTKETDRQVKKLDLMEQDLRAFRRLYNFKLSYYKQLQRISDGVTLPDRPGNVAAVRQQCTQEEATIRRKLAALLGRKRYLENLEKEEKERAAKGNKEGQTIGNGETVAAQQIRDGVGSLRECGICKGSIEKGVLTVCGHIYCADCLKFWVSRHRKCPLCNEPLHLGNDIQSITLKAIEQPKNSPVPGSPADSSAATPQLESSSASSLFTNSRRASDLLSTISRIRISGSYGSKLDTILRHIIYLRREDSTTKLLVFSQWEQVLNILATSMTKNHIGFVKLEGGTVKGKGKGAAVVKFKTDPNVAVFMLNARNQSAGLTLVSATHVILVEPVIAVGLEMQGTVDETAPCDQFMSLLMDSIIAINRIHRIGQTKPTYVWRYIVKDTIEERVLALRGVHAERLENVSHRTPKREKMENWSGGGGEMVGNWDVRWCLFGKEESKGAVVDTGEANGIEGEAGASPELEHLGDDDMQMEDASDEGEAQASVVFPKDGGRPEFDSDAWDVLSELRWMVEGVHGDEGVQTHQGETAVSLDEPDEVDSGRGATPATKLGRGRMGRRRRGDKDHGLVL